MFLLHSVNFKLDIILSLYGVFFYEKEKWLYLHLIQWI